MDKELQERIQVGLDWSPKVGRLRYLSLALCGEAGELANLVKKGWRDNKPVDEEKLFEEVADVANYVYMVASHLGIDLEERMLQKLRVVEQRPEFLNRNTQLQP